MKKIVVTDELVEAYLLGDDIGDYTLEDLETSREFMLEVLRTTKKYNVDGIPDIATYENFVSDSLKGDFSFARAAIDIFKDDTADNINKIVNLYNTYTEDSRVKSLELSIIVADLEREDLIDYDIRSFIQLVQDLGEMRNYSGTEFEYIFNKYDSKIIRNFYAKKLVKSYFMDSTIEKLLHDSFYDYSQFLEFGIDEFVVSFASKSDSHLAKYLAENKDILECSYSYFDGIRKNWSNYANIKLRNDISLFDDEYISYMSDNFYGVSFSEKELLTYACSELGILDIFTKYSIFFDDSVGIVFDDADGDIKSTPFDFKNVQLTEHEKEVVDDVFGLIKSRFGVLTDNQENIKK